MPSTAKTTLLNALAGTIHGRERVVCCEEVFELRLPAAYWVAMQTRQTSLDGTGEIPLYRLVQEALRMTHGERSGTDLVVRSVGPWFSVLCGST